MKILILGLIVPNPQNNTMQLKAAKSLALATTLEQIYNTMVLIQAYKDTSWNNGGVI